MREYQVRIYEGLRVKFPGPTRHKPISPRGQDRNKLSFPEQA